MAILVTGGLGYIGSHTCIRLLESNMDIIVVDNLCNSKISVIKRIEEITSKKFKFYNCDLCILDNLNSVFLDNEIDAVIHFAGLKSVGQSVEIPLTYYHNNLLSTINLLTCMEKFDVKKLIFSSSATVYKNQGDIAIDEEFPLSFSNPYGNSKLIIEQMLRDIVYGDHKRNDNSFINNYWEIIILRYFNPVGAHTSGKLGENPNGIPNNLMPYISQVAVGKLDKLKVFGDNYNTKDGTGIRDYLHVMDLAEGHIAALGKLSHVNGIEVYNLGTGQGYSVLEVVSTFEKSTGIKIPYEIVGPRQGDVAICYADPSKAQRELGWKAICTLEEICKSSWDWQKVLLELEI